MERVTKKIFTEQMNTNRFYVMFLDYPDYKHLREGYLANITVSLYSDVYNLDDVFMDKAYLILIRKSAVPEGLAQKVRIVENPSGIYEKDDNDLEELKMVITKVDLDADFFYIRETVI